MKEFTVRVPMESYAFYTVEANTPQEALEKAKERDWKYDDTENNAIQFHLAEVIDDEDKVVFP